MLKVTKYWSRQYTKLLSLCKALQADTKYEEKSIHIMGFTVVLVIFIMPVVKLCFCSQPNVGQIVCVIRWAWWSFLLLILPNWIYSLNKQVCVTVTYCVYFWEVPSLSANQDTGIMPVDFVCFILSLTANAREISQAMIVSFQNLFISPPFSYCTYCLFLEQWHCCKINQRVLWYHIVFYCQCPVIMHNFICVDVFKFGSGVSIIHGRLM
jgi:hypothetical protein